MSETGLYNTVQIASNFMEQAKKLAMTYEFEAAFAALKKAQSYAFKNDELLEDIQLRLEMLGNAQRHYIRQLEEKVIELFNQESFDGQTAREALQILREHDQHNEIAQSLWRDLQAKEAAEREHRLVDEFQQTLEQIWEKAQSLKKSGNGTGALIEYERAVTEASKKVGDAPNIIPLQRLKLEAIEKRDRIQEKWEEIPKLILAGNGFALVEHYERLKNRGEAETEFFDAHGKFAGFFAIDDCIERAKALANSFAQQKIQVHLDQAQELLVESPGAAYDKIQEAFAADLSESARSLLEQELEEKIRPAIAQRESALALLNMAINAEDPVESWATLNQVEQMDRFTPGLSDARNQLSTTLEQKLRQLLETGEQFLDLEDFETAQARFTEAISVGQSAATYNEALERLFDQVQEALEHCRWMQHEVTSFEQQLSQIASLSQTEPEQANTALAALETDKLSEQALSKIEALRVQIDFQVGVERLYQSLEQKTVASTDTVDLISLEEGAKQASADYPDEERFPRLVERIMARRAFLKGSALATDPETYVEALNYLRQTINLKGDDESAAQKMVDKLSINEQQEADIAIAIEEANQALENDNPREAFLLLQSFRYAASRQAARVRELISNATTRWRDNIERQLETLLAAEEFVLPKVEFLIAELESAQSPRVREWQVKALAPAYAVAATDLQELDCWDEAAPLWDEAFRLSPQDPTIVEGRHNVHKHQAVRRVKSTVDPVEKEQLMNDLNRIYSDDPLIKRYLAAFYFSQKRYAETRLALSQIKSLLGHSGGPLLDADLEAIRHMERRLEETEAVEKRKSAIQRKAKGSASTSHLKDARLAYQDLLEAVPEQTASLQQWWKELIRATISDLNAQVANISEKAGTAWIRAELLCKILVLKSDPQVEMQAQRMLKIAYDQLPPDIEMVTETPEGIAYDRPGAALDNHIIRAKTLYERAAEMNQLENIMNDLGIKVVPPHEIEWNESLYKLELTLERLYFTQEKRREIKHQMAVGMVTGKWKPIEDSLQELGIKGWNEHQSVQDLLKEVEKAQRQRANLEIAVKQVDEAMNQENFEVVQERLAYMLDYDPDDETQLQANLEVTDPYTWNKIKGREELEQIIPDKLAAIEKLNAWQIKNPPIIDWPTIRLNILDLANQAQFKVAVELAEAARGENDEHPLIARDSLWSLERELQYLESFPLSSEEINSRSIKFVSDQTDQKIIILSNQLNECKATIESLQEKQQAFKQILAELKPLFQRLDERKDFLRSIFSSPAEVDEIKQKVLILVKQGCQICPAYPAFANFDEDKFLKR